jgi:endonuclease YncB( thermonuclease family)
MRQFFLVLLICAVPASAGERLPPLIGPARVIDGDTIDVAGTRVRVRGIAAPDIGSRAGSANERAAGLAAKHWLEQYLASRWVLCRDTGERTHARVVARCEVDGQDLGRLVVAAGHALDCPRWSRYAYRALERPSLAEVYRRPDYCQPRVKS